MQRGVLDTVGTHIGQLFRTNGHSFSLLRETTENDKHPRGPKNSKWRIFKQMTFGKFWEYRRNGSGQWQGNCHSFHESEWDSSGGSLQTRISGYWMDPKEKA
jgi:hypothetical protein